MKRCVIVGGADIKNYEVIRKYLKPDDFFIFCDCGLRHAEKLKAEPDLIVGDFDTHEKPDTETETIVLPCEKDDTDSVFAVKEALKRGFEDFLLIGAVGNRMDHTVVNVSLLLYLEGKNKKAVIIDDYSEMEIVSDTALIEDKYKYFSLLNISGKAQGITITGAKYPLTDGEITCEYQYGVSNEVLPQKTARVTVKEGRLLLIKTRY